MTASPHLRAGSYPPPISRLAITLKWASSLDGRIATSSGSSKWITGREARVEAHRLRAEHDAVLVGIETVLSDDPELTVRLVEGKNPARIVLDSRLRTPTGAQLLSGDVRVIIATTARGQEDRSRELERLGAEIVTVATDQNDQVDLLELMERLPALGVRSLLVEGGAAVLTSFLRLRLADRVVVFVAPTVMGTGLDAIGNLDVREVDLSIRIEGSTYEKLGEDIMISGKPVWPTE